MAANVPSGEKEAGESVYTCQACTAQLSPRDCLPFILPCHHTICATCIARLHRGGNSVCPTCDSALPSTLEHPEQERLGTEQLPIDETFSKLVELERNQEALGRMGVPNECKDLQQHLQKTIELLVKKASLIKTAHGAALLREAEDSDGDSDTEVNPTPEPAVTPRTESPKQRQSSGRQSRKKRNKNNRRKGSAAAGEKKGGKAGKTGKGKKSDPGGSEADDPCEIHPGEQIRYYCKTCQAAVCQICVKDHNERVGHQLVDIVVAAEEAQKEVLLMCRDLGQIQQSAQDKVQELQSSLAEMDAGHNRTLEDINTHFADIVSTIRARKAQVMADIESKVTEQRVQLEDYLEDLRSLQSAVDTTSAMGRRLAAVGGDPEALQRRCQHLQNLMINVPDPPPLQPLVDIDEVQVSAIQEVITRMGEITSLYDKPTGAGEDAGKQEDK